MRAWKALALCLLAVGLVVRPASAAGAETKRVTLPVRGMACPFCALTVESVLKGVEGVIAAEASFTKGQAVVTYDPKKTSPAALVEAINTKTFYRASLPAGDGADFRKGARQIALKFERPFDPRRTWEVAMGLKELPGVTAVNALPDGRVGVTFDPKVVDEKRILARVKEAGHPVLGVEPLSAPDAGPGGRGPLLYGALGGALLLSAGLFFYRMRSKSRKERGPAGGLSTGGGGRP